ncbi:MAG: methyltransferase [Candidatus Eremiobacteraeota bacterium]|nr:methyltransferase [Candidatus Eremiobacteraeota bacterium]
MSAREVALAVVRDVFSQTEVQRAAQESLDYRLHAAQLDHRDAAFATALAYGAIKMRRTLDWYLRPYLEQRKAPLPFIIGEIARLGVYEMRFLGAQPYAVVSQWVNLAKRFGHRGTAGLINAVLRGFARDNPKPPQREEFLDELEFWAVTYSFPTWLVRQWHLRFGSTVETLLRGCNDPAQAALTINRKKIDRAGALEKLQERGIAARTSPFAHDSVLIQPDGAPRRALASGDGSWWTQSESSAMVADVLHPHAGERIADLCSGRGNKALQIASRLGDEDTVVCVERDARKAAQLERRAREASLCAAAVVADATRPLPGMRFDRILLDAPCSGTGVVGRHPEARWRKHSDDGERLAVLQASLLEAASAMLYEGGAIVYAVCSIDPRETTAVVDGLVRGGMLDRGLVPERFRPFQTPEGDVIVPPGVEGRDGFFISRLERRA